MITNIWEFVCVSYHMNAVRTLKLTAAANFQVSIHLDFFLYSVRLSKRYS